MTILTITLFALQAAAVSVPYRDQALHERQEPAPAAEPCAPKRVVEVTVKHERNIRQGSFLPRITMAIGSPPQDFSALFDTGSGDLLVGKTGSDFCAIGGANCSAIAQGGRGSLNLNSSAAPETIGPLAAHYFNGELNLGEFKKADAVFGGVTVKDLQFGLVDALTEDFPEANNAPLAPLLGVGPILGETPNTTAYPNLPARMRDIGTIRSNVFGVYLNDFRGTDGSVVFGGVDAAKFTGELKEAPLVPVADTNKASRFQVAFSSLQLINAEGVNKPSKARSHVGAGSNCPSPVTGNATAPNDAVNLAPSGGFPPAFIDTGNSQILIPQSSVDMLAKSLGGQLRDGFIGPVDCNALQGKSLRFGFNNDNVVVDLPLELTLVPKELSTLQDGTCETVIGPSDSLSQEFGLVSLGAPMMQSMYIVFDVERNRLLFAPAVMNSTQSDVRELGPDWTGTVNGTGSQGRG
ncbi:hypothetical protein PWT90_03679 [Aphanocladium album]|nr:hypothetical protein PWT90_03679 [Aphanocladium album]